MPQKLLAEYFEVVFGQLISADSVTSEQLFWLRSGKADIDELRFQSNLRYRALVVASTSYFRSGKPFISLAERFGVSPTAMAIQLEYSGLVVV